MITLFIVWASVTAFGLGCIVYGVLTAKELPWHD